MERKRNKKFALLIDAENVSAKYMEQIINKASIYDKYGVLTIKRAYGDFTKLNNNAKSEAKKVWKNTCLDFSISPIQQYAYTTGKNNGDIAMVIDAMDILYTQDVDGFFIVTSDSDFTPLAARLRESGKLVVGMGEVKTPPAFRNACEKFIPLNEYADADKDEKVGVVKADISTKTKLQKVIISIINDLENDGDDGWVSIADVGNNLSKLYPDFDPTTYNKKKLSDLLMSLDKIEMQKIKINSDPITYKYLAREKRKKSKE